MLSRRSVRIDGMASARSSWLIMPVDRPVRLATSWIEKPARWRSSRTVSPRRRWSTASSLSIAWAFFGTLDAAAATHVALPCIVVAHPDIASRDQSQ